MSFLRNLVTHRERPEPYLDEGLQAERTAIAWQRTALGVGGFGGLLLHMAQHNLVALVPALLGLVVALVLLFLVERRYVISVRKVEAGHSPLPDIMLHLLIVTVVLLAVSAIVLLVLAQL